MEQQATKVNQLRHAVGKLMASLAQQQRGAAGEREAVHFAGAPSAAEFPGAIVRRSASTGSSGSESFPELKVIISPGIASHEAAEEPVSSPAEDAGSNAESGRSGSSPAPEEQSAPVAALPARPVLLPSNMRHLRRVSFADGASVRVFRPEADNQSTPARPDSALSGRRNSAPTVPAAFTKAAAAAPEAGSGAAGNASGAADDGSESEESGSLVSPPPPAVSVQQRRSSTIGQALEVNLGGSRAEREALPGHTHSRQSGGSFSATMAGKTSESDHEEFDDDEEQDAADSGDGKAQAHALLEDTRVLIGNPGEASVKTSARSHNVLEGQPRVGSLAPSSASVDSPRSPGTESDELDTPTPSVAVERLPRRKASERSLATTDGGSAGDRLPDEPGAVRSRRRSGMRPPAVDPMAHRALAHAGVEALRDRVAAMQIRMNEAMASLSDYAHILSSLRDDRRQLHDALRRERRERRELERAHRRPPLHTETRATDSSPHSTSEAKAPVVIGPAAAAVVESGAANDRFGAIVTEHQRQIDRLHKELESRRFAVLHEPPVNGLQPAESRRVRETAHSAAQTEDAVERNHAAAQTEDASEEKAADESASTAQWQALLAVKDRLIVDLQQLTRGQADRITQLLAEKSAPAAAAATELTPSSPQSQPQVLESAAVSFWSISPAGTRRADAQTDCADLAGVEAQQPGPPGVHAVAQTDLVEADEKKGAEDSTLTKERVLGLLKEEMVRSAALEAELAALRRRLSVAERESARRRPAQSQQPDLRPWVALRRGTDQRLARLETEFARMAEELAAAHRLARMRDPPLQAGAKSPPEERSPVRSEPASPGRQRRSRARRAWRRPLKAHEIVAVHSNIERELAQYVQSDDSAAAAVPAPRAGATARRPRTSATAAGVAQVARGGASAADVKEAITARVQSLERLEQRYQALSTMGQQLQSILRLGSTSSPTGGRDLAVREGLPPPRRGPSSSAVLLSAPSQGRGDDWEHYLVADDESPASPGDAVGEVEQGEPPAEQA